MTAHFAIGQPAGKSDAPEETVPRKYQAFVSDGGHRGVIDDPDGYANVRSGQRKDAPVVAKVKTGELFSFEREECEEWCKVTLASGKTGWMHANRIRLFFTKDDLPGKSDQDGEIDKQARHHGVDYYEVTQGAVRGDPEARKKFFAVASNDKAAVAEMTKFPVSMPYLVKAVKNKPESLRRYDEIFKGEANAAQCFASAKPQKESARRYEIYCPFKDTPDDRENAPVRFIFELTKSGWKFAGLDNINE